MRYGALFMGGGPKQWKIMKCNYCMPLYCTKCILKFILSSWNLKYFNLKRVYSSLSMVTNFTLSCMLIQIQKTTRKTCICHNNEIVYKLEKLIMRFNIMCLWHVYNNHADGHNILSLHSCIYLFQINNVCKELKIIEKTFVYL